MTKKILIAASAVVVGLVVLYTTKVGSYACLGWSKVKKGIDKSVPPEVEVERLRAELERLPAAQRKYASKLADEIVEVEALRGKVNKMEEELTGQEKTILLMRERLSDNSLTKITINDKEYSRSKVEADLTRKFETFKIGKESLKSQKQLLEQKERGLEEAREHLKAMDTTKRQLEVEVAKLDADLKNLRAQQTKSKFSVDDGKVGAIKNDVAKLRDRIRAEQLALKINAEFEDSTIEAQKEVKNSDVLKEIDAYFGKKPAVAEKP
jgi:hypothetical protein